MSNILVKSSIKIIMPKTQCNDQINHNSNQFVFGLLIWGSRLRPIQDRERIENCLCIIEIARICSDITMNKICKNMKTKAEWISTLVIRQLKSTQLQQANRFAKLFFHWYVQCLSKICKTEFGTDYHLRWDSPEALTIDSCFWNLG